MRIMNYIKSLCMQRRQRYVSLGQTERGMFFIDCYTCKIYRLANDYRTDCEVVAVVCEV